MALLIDFLDETNTVQKEHLTLIEGLLQHAALEEQLEDASELSVTFVSNAAIRELNRQYRQKDQPTDVISFALEEIGEGETQIVGDGLPRILGDIVISIERAQEQAQDYGHSFERELGFLAVHGFLHLLGYDHMNEREEKEMFEKQHAILRSFGLGREA